MKKYKTGGYTELIKEVEIIRETEKSVFIKRETWKGIKNVREAKRGNYLNYFDTAKEAKEFLKGKYESNIQRYKLKIKFINKSLAKLKDYNI